MCIHMLRRPYNLQTMATRPLEGLFVEGMKIRFQEITITKCRFRNGETHYPGRFRLQNSAEKQFSTGCKIQCKIFTGSAVFLSESTNLIIQ